ncbi:MAG: FAD:protein FMN transferase [Anaerolineaceae bacterium]
MDTDIDVIIESEDSMRPFGAFSGVRLLFEAQEQRYSRFRATSLVSQLNAGENVDDPWLAAACRMALDAYEFTGGLFNPLILESLERAGYAKTFDEVTDGTPEAAPSPLPRDALTVAGSVVALRHGRLDLGGIIKGWTVDLAVDMLARAEPNVLVNAGGDLRCAGNEGGNDGWLVTITAPEANDDAWEGAIHGALTTSTSLKRRWKTAGGGVAHHLIDPRTGLPAASSFVQVSAWHALAWRAECWAKAVLIGGEKTGRLAAADGVRLLAMDAAFVQHWF